MTVPSNKDIDAAKAKVREFLKPLLTEDQLREASRRIAAFTALAVKQQRDFTARLAAKRALDPLVNLADVILNGRKAR